MWHSDAKRVMRTYGITAYCMSKYHNVITLQTLNPKVRGIQMPKGCYVDVEFKSIACLNTIM